MDILGKRRYENRPVVHTPAISLLFLFVTFSAIQKKAFALNPYTFEDFKCISNLIFLHAYLFVFIYGNLGIADFRSVKISLIMNIHFDVVNLILR